MGRVFGNQQRRRATILKQDVLFRIHELKTN